jgi:Ca-activated chloride channel homolog
VIAILFAVWLQPTNSRAATARGMGAYEKKDYATATNAFAQANALKLTPSNAFNLGTAQVANGKREEGSATLARAMNDRALRADALYNRGNSALAANAYDYAIRDYVETLKLRPSDAKAKRNLEIALQKKQAMQQKSGGNQKNPQNAKGGQKPTPSAGNRREEKPQPDASAEALLRAVQQQEQEELQRMKKARATRGRVGW